MPANLIIETSSAHLISEEGVDVEFRLGYDITRTTGQPRLLLNVYKNGVLVGTPTRYHLSGNRVARDEPGVTSTDFITEDGHITNG